MQAHSPPRYPRRIKILFSVPRFSVGGAEKFLARHLSRIDRQKYDVTLATIFKEQVGSSCAEQVHVDKCFDARSTWDIRAFKELIAFVRKGNFDVVVTHLFTSNLLVRAAAILAGVPVIVSYEHNIYPNKRYWQIIADKILSWWTYRIIADSDAAKHFTSKQEHIPLNKFHTIIIPPLHDNRPRRARKEVLDALNIPHDALIAVTVSRLVVDKGHRYLLDAIPVVLKKYPHAYFLIGGWGPLKGKLEAQAEQLGISKNARILGRVDGQEYTSFCDLYIDPSISTDLPIGIMEAMEKSRAIVATSVGEIPNFVQHEKSGLIVPPADPDALAAAIDQMLAEKGLRERYGAAAKKKVSEYSMENYIQTFDAVIDASLTQ